MVAEDRWRRMIEGLDGTRRCNFPDSLRYLKTALRK